MRAAVCQMRSVEDVDANLAEADRLIGEGAGDGADLAALPELFAHLGPARRVAELAEPVPDGPTCRMLSDAARERAIWVLGGSIAERDGDRVYNTSLLFDREGTLVARYRKLHLFDVQLPGQPPFRESATFAEGTELVTHETEFGRLGLSICYDLRFPELYRGLMAVGAEVLLVPAQFQQATGRDHWEVLLRARAIENQCFVVAPAQWGTFGGGSRRSFGNSAIVDPWGRVLVQAPEEGTGVWSTDLDFGELRRVRRTLPALEHRRLGRFC
jgi:deaminated glutathione amidase